MRPAAVVGVRHGRTASLGRQFLRPDQTAQGFSGSGCRPRALRCCGRWLLGLRALWFGWRGVRSSAEPNGTLAWAGVLSP